MEIQYEMAMNIYEALIPRSLEYYLGVIEMPLWDQDEED